MDSVFTNYDWEKVGKTINDSEVAVLGLGHDDTKYLAYRNSTNKKVVVKMFDGSSWDDYGIAGYPIGSMTGNSNFLSIASTGNNGELFLAYNSTANNIEVKSISDSNSAWSSVGSVGSGAGAIISDIVIKIDSKDNPYFFSIVNNKGIVYSSSTIPSGFDYFGTFSDAYSGDFIIDSSDRLVIAYARPDGLYVEFYEGKSWSKLGKNPVLATTGTISGISLASFGDKIYVAYESAKFQKAITVRLFDGGTWEELPRLNLAEAPSLKITKKGMPILAVRDLSKAGYHNIASVYVLEGNKWRVLGRNKIEDNIIETDSPINMELDSEGNPVVSFSRKAGLFSTKSTSVRHATDK